MTDAHDVNGNLKTIYPTHVLVKDPNLTKESIIKLEHIRSVSKNRLTEYMTDLNDDEGVIKEIEKNWKICYVSNNDWQHIIMYGIFKSQKDI